jgi:hypothetical protein
MKSGKGVGETLGWRRTAREEMTGKTNRISGLSETENPKVRVNQGRKGRKEAMRFLGLRERNSEADENHGSGGAGSGNGRRFTTPEADPS